MWHSRQRTALVRRRSRVQVPSSAPFQTTINSCLFCFFKTKIHKYQLVEIPLDYRFAQCSSIILHEKQFCFSFLLLGTFSRYGTRDPVNFIDTRETCLRHIDKSRHQLQSQTFEKHCKIGHFQRFFIYQNFRKFQS